MKLGEANARLEQMKVALDSTQLSKQSAERQAALAEEKAREVIEEVKRIKSAVSLWVAYFRFCFFIIALVAPTSRCIKKSKM